MKISINGLNNVQTAFGIVKLPTNDINYIPLAYNFENEIITKKKCANNEVIEIDNKYYGIDDAQKKYQAFVFSIQSSNLDFKYDIQIEEVEETSEEKGTNNWKTIILIIILIIAILLIIIIVIIVIKKKKGKNNIENLSSQPLEQNNKYILSEMMDENL